MLSAIAPSYICNETYVHSDDIGHGKERGQSSTKLGGEPRIADLIGL